MQTVFLQHTKPNQSGVSLDVISGYRAKALLMMNAVWMRLGGSTSVDAKRNKHVSNGATMVPLVVATFCKLDPSAQGCLQSSADVAGSSVVVGRGLWLRIARQYFSCALVRERGIVCRHYYQSIAESAGKDFRDGAVVPFE